MLRPEMNLPERSEFSSQALLLIRFQILYFSQIPEWNKDPASRISVPFYPGNSEYFPVFLNSSSFRQIRNSHAKCRTLSLIPIESASFLLASISSSGSTSTTVNRTSRSSLLHSAAKSSIP